MDKIKDWEIWHTYATYFKQPNPDLLKVALRLLEADLIQSVTVSEEYSLYNETHGETAYNKATHQQGVLLEKLESSLVVDTSPLRPACIRAYMAPCMLMDDSETIPLYPSIKIYETGVILLNLKLSLDAERDLSVDEFINRYVNLFQRQFDTVVGPVGLAEYAPAAYTLHETSQWTLKKKWKFIREQNLHHKAIHEIKVKAPLDEIHYEVAPLTKATEYSETLSTVSLTIFNVIRYFLCDPQTKLRFFFSEPRRLSPLGNIWTGRPHIQIFRHDNQKVLASKNEDDNRVDMARLLLKTTADARQDYITEALPKSALMTEDQSVFVSSASSLWIWSDRGRRKLETPQSPFMFQMDSTVLANQIFTEWLEYGYMLQLFFAEAAEDSTSLREVFQIRGIVEQLHNQMVESVFAGEVRDMIERGWQTMGTNKTQSRIESALSILQDEESMNEQSRRHKSMFALQLLFGLLASVEVSKFVVKPLWLELELPIFAEKAFANLQIFAVTVIPLSILVAILRGKYSAQ